MNKELIKKYKDEFDYWLNGGKLQVKFVNDPWEEAPESIFSFTTVNFILVIEDEYLFYRKAMAEGKIVQQQDYYSKQWVDMKTDHFQSSTDTFYEGVYRIKPEEPKFKVGDWVRAPSGCIYQINETNIIHGTEHFTMWQPQPDEWCWFWDDNNAPHIGQFRSMQHRTYYSTSDMSSFTHCEPFIGNLPTHLKE